MYYLGILYSCLYVAFHFVFLLLYKKKKCIVSSSKITFLAAGNNKRVSGKSLQIFDLLFCSFEYMDVSFFVIVHLFNPKTSL